MHIKATRVLVMTLMTALMLTAITGCFWKDDDIPEITPVPPTPDIPATVSAELTKHAPTATPTPTPTSEPTPTNTPTPTPTATPQPTPTPLPTQDVAAIVAALLAAQQPTATPVPTATLIPTPTPNLIDVTQSESPNSIPAIITGKVTFDGVQASAGTAITGHTEGAHPVTAFTDHEGTYSMTIHAEGIILNLLVNGAETNISTQPTERGNIQIVNINR